MATASNYPVPVSTRQVLNTLKTHGFAQQRHTHDSMREGSMSQTMMVSRTQADTGHEMVVIVVIDSSWSMAGICGPDTRLGVTKQSFKTAASLTARKSPHALMGVIAFNHEPQVITSPVPVGVNCEAICNAINSIDTSGGTRLDLAIYETCGLFEQYPERTNKSVLILTDGHSGGNVPKAATRLHQLGAQVFVTGVGNQPTDVNESMLRSVASEIDGQTAYQFVSKASGLTTTVLMQTKLATRPR